MMEEYITNCIFCAKPKDWRSNMVLEVGDNGFRITVCPECRPKKTMIDLNREISKRFFPKKEVKK